ncbi:ABC transporter ATP-binding protein [Leptolyngbya sp. CCNP1308]|uniref:ABC transporter ATP-binding protein n=1 Tax=Leptolyngbya sp. CCNP1308 TaxID=3110255 RepID=UPI002B1E927E|nr:ABC transporter ATP-binding protein [Leptolyngbya sp. CCNP1308]MEA5452646.1 ABC transporter ATP-binding protein [Leptolyngbya sp. CCNP1308]
MASVTFKSVTKRYGEFVALRDLDIEIGDREFLVFVGPSGCGKTTTLRLLAGLDSVTTGDIYIGDRRVNELASRDRDIAMVFQSYALYPHMTVYDNMAFSLELQGLSKGDIQQRVQRAAQQMGLEALLQRKPKDLSGGQRQRVAVCRAIVRDPAVFLMDEPLSNLDAQLRVQARTEISLLHRNLQSTFIYVTHDQVEAMTMGTRIAILNQGVLQQIDTPQAVYSTPKNKFVAGFIGSPAMNFFDGALVEMADQLWFKSDALVLALPTPTQYQRYIGQRVICGIRPEDIHDARYLPPAIVTTPLKGTISHTESMGNEVIVYLTLGDGQTCAARVDRRSTLALGETVELVLNITALHLFDPHTEAAII